jgi:hypothetical protein
MWRVLLIALFVGGCHTPLPPSPHEIQAKRFEPVADKSVIYVVRDFPDANLPATIALGESATITTYPGTFYRWEVAPGRHRISGFAADTGSITLQTQPGQVYYVQQTLNPFYSYASSSFRPVGENQGRAVVTRGQLVPGAQ